jgi:CO/xanthine dehydrogenase FAD-binding subunit
MMRLPKFRYYAPRTVAEAIAIRSDAGPDGAYVAGGTDLYPNMKRRQQTPKVVVGLSRIA